MIKDEMKIGFTGTRKGMTDRQKIRFQETVLIRWATCTDMSFHHGDCVGADIEASKIMQKLDNDIKIHVYPPKNNKFRAFDSAEYIYEEQDYLTRNRNIVNETSILIACPSEQEAKGLGGTWYTINYAKKHGKPVLIIYPDGSFGE